MKKITYWIPVVMLMAVIFLLSTRQRLSVSETYAWNFLFFKTLHVLEYFALFFLTHRAFKYGSTVPKEKIGIFSFIVVLLYAFSDELHQTFVPTREGHIRDVIIDGLGASLAWISIKQLLPLLPTKLKHWVTSLQLI